MSRWLALLIAVVGGAAIGYALLLAVGGAVLGFLWLYVFGDDPWPRWSDYVLGAAILIGGELNGWARSENDVTLSFGTAGPVIYFYPSATGGFYLKGGAGLASLELDIGSFSGNTTGFGVVLGLGFDGRVGRNFSLTPFLDFVGGDFDDGNINTVHLGLGFTFH